MSQVYEFNVRTDFKYSEVDTGLLETQINASGITSATLEGEPTVSGDVCSTTFDGPLSQDDEDTLDDLVAAHVPDKSPAPRYREKKYTNGVNGRILWMKLWATKVGPGDYAGLIEQTDYTYQGNRLVDRTVKEFWPSGSVRKETTYPYVTTGANTVVEEI